MIVAIIMGLLNIDPIGALFWCAVINGVVAVPILIYCTFCERPAHHGRMDEQPPRPDLGLGHSERYGRRRDWHVRFGEKVKCLEGKSAAGFALWRNRLECSHGRL
jgi:hypothetical protein